MSRAKNLIIIWTASSEFGTYSLCEQRRFRRACASAQSRQNLGCSLIQAVSQEEPSDRKPDPWPLWMAGHAQLKFVMTECSKTQIRLMGPIWESLIICEQRVLLAWFTSHAVKWYTVCVRLSLSLCDFFSCFIFMLTPPCLFHRRRWLVTHRYDTHNALCSFSSVLFVNPVDVLAIICNIIFNLRNRWGGYLGIIFHISLSVIWACREIMVLFILCKHIIFQMRMCSRPVVLDLWFLVRPFVYIHTLCEPRVKALVRLWGCTGSPEPLLVAYVISTIISRAGSFVVGTH